MEREPTITANIHAKGAKFGLYALRSCPGYRVEVLRIGEAAVFMEAGDLTRLRDDLSAYIEKLPPELRAQAETKQPAAPAMSPLVQRLRRIADRAADGPPMPGEGDLDDVLRLAADRLETLTETLDRLVIRTLDRDDENTTDPVELMERDNEIKALAFEARALLAKARGEQP